MLKSNHSSLNTSHLAISTLRLCDYIYNAVGNTVASPSTQVTTLVATSLPQVQYKWKPTKQVRCLRRCKNATGTVNRFFWPIFPVMSSSHLDSLSCLTRMVDSDIVLFFWIIIFSLLGRKKPGSRLQQRLQGKFGKQ